MPSCRASFSRPRCGVADAPGERRSRAITLLAAGVHDGMEAVLLRVTSFELGQRVGELLAGQHSGAGGSRSRKAAARYRGSRGIDRSVLARCMPARMKSLTAAD